MAVQGNKLSNPWAAIVVDVTRLLLMVMRRRRR